MNKIYTKFAINAEALLQEMNRDVPGYSQYGVKTFVHGEPMMIDVSRLPFVCIYRDNMSFDRQGIGRGGRNDKLYTFVVEIVYSLIDEDSTIGDMYDVTEAIYEFFIDRSLSLVEGFRSGHLPDFSNMTDGVKPKLMQGKIVYVNHSSFSVSIRRSVRTYQK